MQKVLSIFLTIVTLLHAKEPKLELGFGMAMVGYPDYVGSHAKQTLFMPFPYIRYRGENFQIEKGGVKRELFDLDGLSVDLSLSGSLSSDSTNSIVRDGMPDLDMTFEFGPKFTYDIFKDEKHDISFRIPIRAIFSTDFKKINSEGFLTTPRLRFEYHPIKEIDLSFSTGPMWASEDYHDYFYSVKEIYAKEGRIVYDASGGYSGYRNSLGCQYQSEKIWFGAFVSHYALDGATFVASALVEQKDALFVGASFAYIFYIKH